MTVAKPTEQAAVERPDPADDERPDPTVIARRNARFHFARERIRRIVDGMPPLSDEQLAALARLLREDR